jgi:hypothetical protein
MGKGRNYPILVFPLAFGEAQSFDFQAGLESKAFSSLKSKYSIVIKQLG